MREIEVIIEIDDADDILQVVILPDVPAIGDYIRYKMRVLKVIRRVWKIDDALPSLMQVHVICEEVE